MQVELTDKGAWIRLSTFEVFGMVAHAFSEHVPGDTCAFSGHPVKRSPTLISVARKQLLI